MSNADDEWSPGPVGGRWIDDPRVIEAMRVAADRGEAGADVVDRLSGLYGRLIDELRDPIHCTLLDRVPYVSARRRRALRRFRRVVAREWAEAFDLLSAVQLSAEELGVEMTDHYTNTETGEMASFRTQVLTLLVARACLVCREVLTLLEAGLPQGAHARWRTLHEIAVIAELIHGNDDELAERFLLHELVEQLRDIEVHDEWATRNGWPVTDPVTRQELTEVVALVVEQRGRYFRKPWAWATPITGTEKPTFEQLEQLTDRGQFRPGYREASHLTHSGATGLSRIQVEHFGDPFVMVGPTIFDLASAGILTAQAMSDILRSAMMCDAEAARPEVVANLRAVIALASDASQAFRGVEDRLCGLTGEPAPTVERIWATVRRTTRRTSGTARSWWRWRTDGDVRDLR